MPSAHTLTGIFYYTPSQETTWVYILQIFYNFFDNSSQILRVLDSLK